MALFFSDIGKDVLNAKSEKMAAATALLLDPHTGRFTVLATNKGAYALEHCMLQDKNFLLLEDAMSFPLEDDPRNHKNILGMKVVTKDKKTLGLVQDFAFEPLLFDLVNITVAQKLLAIHWDKRIIPRQHIIDMRGDTIIVQPDQFMEPEQAQAKQPVVEVLPA